MEYKCFCSSCDDEQRRHGELEPLHFRMNLCPDCGNKRCPKAIHHDNMCTNSNELGKDGSRY